MHAVRVGAFRRKEGRKGGEVSGVRKRACEGGGRDGRLFEGVTTNPSIILIGP